MTSFYDYLQALRSAVSDERYPLALSQILMARRELDENRMRALEFAGDTGKRLELLDIWFGDFLTREVKNTLALLAEERKLALLNEMQEEDRGETITVTTAHPLTQRLKEWFIKELTEKFQLARASFKTDPSLIGGVKIRFQDMEVDASMKARFEKIVV